MPEKFGTFLWRCQQAKPWAKPSSSPTSLVQPATSEQRRGSHQTGRLHHADMPTWRTSTLAANPHIDSKLTYIAEKDFAPVGPAGALSRTAGGQQPAAHQELRRISSLGQGCYSTAGQRRQPHHLATELQRMRCGLNFVHAPYRSAAPAVQDAQLDRSPSCS
ncbi:hypothetical protein FSY45_26950 [Comamonas sp. Z1]|nr:hypothetical protein FSY45_26950 [Comamonas sp. Z1]